MAQSYVDKVADELADLALADQERTGDIAIVDTIGDVLGASSQTLQETYLTAVRVRRAETRARALLADRASSRAGKAHVPLAELVEDDDPAEDAPPMVADAETETPALPAPELEQEPEGDDAPSEPATNMPRRVKR